MQWMTHLAVACLLLTPVSASEVELLFFTGPRCPHCTRVKPVVDDLQARGYPVRTVDYSIDPETVNRFGINQFPTFVLMHRGRPIDQAVGVISAERMRGMMDSAFALEQAAATLANSQNGIAGPPAPALGPPQLAQPHANFEPAARQAGGSRQAAGMAPPPRFDVQPSSAADANAEFENTPGSERQSGGNQQPEVYDPQQVGWVEQLNRAQTRALEATVRIQVIEANTLATGSGTIIDQRGNDALVLTCGHLFREAGPNSQVEVEIGFLQQVRRYPAMVLAFDSEAHDVALLTVRVDGPVVTAPLAPANYPLDQGDSVFSVGCDGGNDPTVFRTQIKAITRYQAARKYDTYGRPEQGRSGGGLFTAGGQLIGVCNSRAVYVDEGIFAGKEGILAILTECRLQDLVLQPEFLAERDPRVLNPEAAATLASSDPQRADGFGSQSPATGGNRWASTAASRTPENSLASVTVAIADPQNPGQQRVIVIDNPSEELLRQLEAHAAQQSGSYAGGSLQGPPSQLGALPSDPSLPWATAGGSEVMRGQSPR